MNARVCAWKGMKEEGGHTESRTACRTRPVFVVRIVIGSV